MQVSRASPLPQHLLSSRRKGADRAVATPLPPENFTSHHVPWHAPQKSTMSTGFRRAGLTIVPAEFSVAPASAAACMAATCFTPGPWHASQLTPRMRFFSSNWPPIVEAVVWHAKQRTISAEPSGRYIASATSFGEASARAGVKLRFCKFVKNVTRDS